MKPLRPEHHVPRTYDVRHVTRYTYSDDVTASYGRACLRPRDCPGQQVHDHEIRVAPLPHALVEHSDLFGNHSHYLEVRTPHRELEVAKTFAVDVDRPAPDLAGLQRWSIAEAAAVRGGEPALLHAAYRLPSALVELGPEVRAFAGSILAPTQPLGEALDTLISTVFTEFRYVKGVTTVRTTLPELLTLRAGVCQDFAHLAIGCLRAFGVPSRYVSGYLETQPPPGQAKLMGADATHAWLEVQLPDATWLGLDPTNDCVVDGRYVVSSWGRDYRDVAPLKGVIFTDGASSSLDVSVDVLRRS